MTARIATRNGQPAYKDAPPRLRASQIERPVPMDTPREPIWRRWFKGGRHG